MPQVFFLWMSNLDFSHSLETGIGGQEYRAGYCTKATDKVIISFMCQTEVLLRVNSMII